MKKKRVNPRRVPLAKTAFDKNAILKEATDGIMNRTWLIVLTTLIDLGLILASDIVGLTTSVNETITAPGFSTRTRNREMKRMEALMGIASPYPDFTPSYIASPVDLEHYKRKVQKTTEHTALCVLCSGLESTGWFKEEDLKRVFLNVAITINEIEEGHSSIETLEREMQDRIQESWRLPEEEYQNIK